MNHRRAVALNGRFTGTKQPTGTQTAAFGLFDAIVQAPEREIPLVVFADPQFVGVANWEKFPHVELVSVPLQSWSRGRAQLWEQLVFPRLCRKYNCPVAHHPITTSPVCKGDTRSVVTLHDLNFFRHPEWYSLGFRLTYAVTALASLRDAERVVTISDYVREQAKRELKVPPDRLRRVYNGVKFTAAEESFAHTDVPYLLCVGSLQPHKNLPRLIRAFSVIKQSYPELELWVVGRPQPRFSEMPELHELLQSPGVKLLGYLSDAELRATYANALVFCYPSLEEGFGLPMLEAMIAGTPVMTSNCSCLPEIGGPAAELANPLDEESIAAAITKLLQLDVVHCKQRVALGREWALQFTWHRAALEYLEIYRELL